MRASRLRLARASGAMISARQARIAGSPLPNASVHRRASAPAFVLGQSPESVAPGLAAGVGVGVAAGESVAAARSAIARRAVNDRGMDSFRSVGRMPAMQGEQPAVEPVAVHGDGGHKDEYQDEYGHHEFSRHESVPPGR
jgi:hypothetical protein